MGHMPNFPNCTAARGLRSNVRWCKGSVIKAALGLVLSALSRSAWRAPLVSARGREEAAGP